MKEENPFKKIALPPQEPPRELKVKVMSEIATIKLLEEITNLFTLNYPSVAKEFFKKKNNN